MIAGVPFAHAQEVILKDGTVYSGYVSEQLPSGRVCINYTNATYSVPGDSLHFTYGSDDKVVLRWGDRFFDDALIWEEGDLVKFTAPTPGTVYVKMSDLQSIRYPINEQLHDVVVAGKTYEGNIIETVVGKYTKIKVGDKIIVLANNKITSQTKVSVDKERSLNIKMFPYLDIYEMQKSPSLTGALISQNHTDGSAIFLTKEGALMPIMVNKITAIRKMPNDLYEERGAMEKDTVEVRINGEEARWLPVVVARKDEVSFPLNDLTSTLMMINDKTIDISVLKSSSNSLILIPFEPFSAKSDVYNLGKREDWTTKVIRPSSTASDEQREITEYKEVASGFYLLLNLAKKAIIPIWVN